MPSAVSIGFMQVATFICADFSTMSRRVMITPHCSSGGLIKPDVVIYEEGLDQRTLRGAVEAISAADLLIVGGTSLSVYPAAGLIDDYRGNRLVLVNKTATPRDARADLIIREPIGKLFAELP